MCKKKNIKMKNSVAKIVLVGRTNVGKSTIFNRLVKGGNSIVFDRSGVTRDHIQDYVSWKGQTFELIDTGGLVAKRERDNIASLLTDKIMHTLSEAHLIVFVGDGKVGPTALDREIARRILREKKETLALVNKCDSSQMAENIMGEFYQLGFKNIMPMSAVHGRGVSELLDYFVEHVPTGKLRRKEADCSVVLLGKPNVGKSSLLNLLLRQERSVVSPEAGTTREAIREQLTFYDQAIELVDTAGVRRKRKVDDPLESLMVKSSLAAMRMADIVLLMVDASEERLLDQELKLLFYALEHKKCVVLLFNKVDLLDDIARERLNFNLLEYQFILKKIQRINISCTEVKNIGKIMQAVQAVWKRCQQSIDPSDLDENIKSALIKKPMYSRNELLKVRKIRPLKAAVPTFAVHVDDPAAVNESHVGYLENILRKKYDFTGCPVVLVFRKIRFTG